MAQRNQITGKLIAVSDRQTIPSKDASKQPMVKRQLYMDCTRYDPYTTPVLEFANKALEKLEGLMTQGLKKGDIITVSFDIQGNKWQNQDGKTQIITSIRPYDIEVRPAQGQTAQPAQAPAPAPAPAPTAQPAQGQQQGQGAYKDANGEDLSF